MTDDIPGVRPPRRIYRLGYGSDAWEWPPHEFVGNGRWDDPDGRYRVLYASSERLGPFVETMGDFETDPYLEAVWLQIDGEDEATGPGQAPSDWLKVHRVFGTAAVKGPFAASARTRSLRFFQDRLGSFAAIHGFAVIDAAAIRGKDNERKGPHSGDIAPGSRMQSALAVDHTSVPRHSISLASRRRLRELGYF